MNRKIIITLKGLFTNRKMVFPIEELIPNLPPDVPANNHTLEKFITRIITEGIIDKSSETNLVLIAPSQIKSIELQFEAPNVQPVMTVIPNE